jgi:hypothetical protein
MISAHAVQNVSPLLLTSESQCNKLILTREGTTFVSEIVLTDKLARKIGKNRIVDFGTRYNLPISIFDTAPN